MPRFTYHMTRTAFKNLEKAIRDTQKMWGLKQAIKYRADFLTGLQYIADNHQTFSSLYRTELAKDTIFSIHRVEHRYVAFQKYGKHAIIVAGIFHESMDIPARLQELQHITKREITALKRMLDR